jgi:hypothetical protein
MILFLECFQTSLSLYPCPLEREGFSLYLVHRNLASCCLWVSIQNALLLGFHSSLGFDAIVSSDLENYFPYQWMFLPKWKGEREVSHHKLHPPQTYRIAGLFVSFLAPATVGASHIGRFAHGGKNPWYPLHKRRGGPQCQYGRHEEAKKSSPYLDLNIDPSLL